MAIDETVLFQGELLDIRATVCRPDHTGAGEVEQVEEDTLILPGRGVFYQHFSSKQGVLAEATNALLFARGRPYRVSHPNLGGDHCLALVFAADALRQTLATAAGVESFGAAALRPAAVLAAPAIAARELLWRRLTSGRADPLEIEETGLLLLSSAAAAASAGVMPARVRAGTRARHHQEVTAVRKALLEDPGRRWRLPELGRRVFSSPYHLARIFRMEVGMGLHQYQLRVRLARAVKLLLDTRREVTAIALELGFSTHSHFTATFRQAVGMTPGDLRRSATTVGARDLLRSLLDASAPGPFQRTAPSVARVPWK